MGLTVRHNVQCPKCEYKTTFTRRYGPGEEEASDGEDKWAKAKDAEVADEHPNHPKDV
jgi:hypothetical protein